MKKHLLYALMAALPAMGAFTACNDKEEIVFDHELQQFPTRADAVLLEVIMPNGTAIDDEIYIVGAFNGGEEAAVGNPMWLLEKSQKVNIKWGIYVNPNDFVDGKTLADGYYFYSAAQGAERTLTGETVMHTDNPAVGSWCNIYVDRWKSYFDKPLNPDEIVHDGYAVFVVDNTGYDELAMYAWGDAEAFGGWPGMQPTGTVTISGVTYKYFDTGKDNEGLNLNLIFNNNGGNKQLADFNVTLNKDYYLELTPDGVVDFDPSAVVTHDGFAIFVSNQTGWDDSAVTMYMWGDVNDLNGGWPGMSVTGTVTVNGVDYLYFDFGEANTGLNENLIFSNNGSNQLGDFNFTIDRDVYVEITKSGVVEIDPDTYNPSGVAPEPEPEPEPDPDPTEPSKPAFSCNIYIENLTGWDVIALYAWGDTEKFGGWPGALPTGTTTLDGVSYTYWTVEGYGESLNLIFNNNGGGTQLNDFNITLDHDYYLTVDADGVTAR